MTHQMAFVGILQAVQEHVIEHALVPHAKTAARLVQQIGGRGSCSPCPRHHDLGLPRRRLSAASITAFMPEPHTLLMVVQGTLSGSPPLSAA